MSNVYGGVPPIPTNVLAGDYTVSTLPSAADNARKYAWATDLFGGPGDYCISDGTNWKPVRPLAVLSQVTGNLVLTPLLMPPTIILTGSIGTGITHSISLSTSFAYKGARFRTVRKATGLGSMLVAATALALNSWRDDEFDGANWVQTASGGLL